MFGSGVVLPEGLPISRRKPRSVSAPLMAGASKLSAFRIASARIGIALADPIENKIIAAAVIDLIMIITFCGLSLK
jgi:hypothetical protein